MGILFNNLSICFYNFSLIIMKKIKEKFFTRCNPYKFGHDVVERFFKDDGHIDYVEVRFNTSSEHQAKLVCDIFNDKNYSNVEHSFYPEKDFDPVLLVFGEKYGDNYFLLRQVEELFAVALKVLSERFSQGWYCEPKFNNKDFKLLSDDIIKSLSVKMRDEYLNDKERHERDIREFNEMKKQYSLIKKAIKDKDGELALELLSERKDYEYERFEFINYTKGSDILSKSKTKEL